MMDPTTAHDALTASSSWLKSSFSGQQNGCVELAYAGMVRDSKNPTGPTLTANLVGLLAVVKAGYLDR